MKLHSVLHSVHHAPERVQDDGTWHSECIRKVTKFVVVNPSTMKSNEVNAIGRSPTSLTRVGTVQTAL